MFGYLRSHGGVRGLLRAKAGEITRASLIGAILAALTAAFLDFQLATSPVAATGKPDAARVEGFLSAHPETRAFMARLRDSDLPSSFANSIYHSVNAFRFTGGAGPARDVRWSMVPEAPLRRWTRERSPRDPRASSSRRSSRASRRARCAGG